MAVYGYCRVSTKSQEDNTSLLNQEEQIKNICSDAIIFKEVSTGKTFINYEVDKKGNPKLDKNGNKRILPNVRKEWYDMEKKLKKGDTLIITKLDRFGRNTSENIGKIQELSELGIKVNILNMGIVDLSNPMGKMMFDVLSAFAEYERALINERLAEGRKVSADAKGVKEIRGRKKVSDEKRKAVIELYKTGNYTYNQIISMTGVSRGKVGDFIREYKQKALEVQERASEKLKGNEILTSEELSSVLENGQQKIEVKKV